MNNIYVLSVLVNNTAGILTRVAGLFTRRAYNIDSLTVGETEDPKFSRMTIAVKCDDDDAVQIISQIKKLEDVKSVDVLKPGTSVVRDLYLIKVKVLPEQRQQVMTTADIFRANIVDVAPESLMIEITGALSKVQAFVDLLDGYEIIEMAHAGMTGLNRGNVKNLD